MEINDYFFEICEEENEQRYFVVICYDIYDNKRRYRFAKFMERFALRVQRSVFEGELSKSTYERLTSHIGEYIDEEDNIRVYRINGNGAIKVWGKVDQVSLEEVIII